MNGVTGTQPHDEQLTLELDAADDKTPEEWVRSLPLTPEKPR